MIVTGPARDGTRLGLMDVGVPRYISEGGSSAHGPPFLLAAARWGRKTCRSPRCNHRDAKIAEDRRYKTVCWRFAAIEMGSRSARRESLSQFQLSKSLVRN